jgi:hypothetical protein
MSTPEELKQLVEENFFLLFDRKIDIQNWDYIYQRARSQGLL